MAYPSVNFAQYRPVIGQAIQMARVGERDRYAREDREVSEADRLAKKEVVDGLMAGTPTIAITNPQTGAKVDVPAETALEKLALYDPQTAKFFLDRAETRKTRGATGDLLAARGQPGFDAQAAEYARQTGDLATPVALLEQGRKRQEEEGQKGAWREMIGARSPRPEDYTVGRGRGVVPLAETQEAGRRYTQDVDLIGSAQRMADAGQGQIGYNAVVAAQKASADATEARNAPPKTHVVGNTLVDSTGKEIYRASADKKIAEKAEMENGVSIFYTDGTSEFRPWPKGATPKKEKPTQPKTVSVPGGGVYEVTGEAGAANLRRIGDYPKADAMTPARARERLSTLSQQRFRLATARPDEPGKWANVVSGLSPGIAEKMLAYDQRDPDATKKFEAAQREALDLLDREVAFLKKSLGEDTPTAAYSSQGEFIYGDMPPIGGPTIFDRSKYSILR